MLWLYIYVWVADGWLLAMDDGLAAGAVCVAWMGHGWQVLAHLRVNRHALALGEVPSAYAAATAQIQAMIIRLGDPLPGRRVRSASSTIGCAPSPGQPSLQSTASNMASSECGRTLVASTSQGPFIVRAIQRNGHYVLVLGMAPPVSEAITERAKRRCGSHAMPRIPWTSSVSARDQCTRAVLKRCQHLPHGCGARCG